ncbi:MAG: thioredoxin domain-containing protein [Candidatus Dadabacteria bacterium]|nr:thioredoxin domain-containing protein [Candidatus Dadabacteria bacterium]
MKEEKENRLAFESSAYLRGASNQPVDWYPWCDEAFQKARELDRPILLDIGAVWCHWCHVIDRESYEDEGIARIINDNFIAIKVDRDERPDVDRRYQQAVSALTGQGGWPLTGFLTPEGKVFFGGTYFPPRDAQNLPSFRNVLMKVIDYYRKNKETVFSESNKIYQALLTANEFESVPGEPSILMVDRAAENMMDLFDPVNGGFGTAPKFPHSGAIELLIARYYETEDEELLHIIDKTLTKSAKGGMYDQVGGGFHRYSVDAQWIVPHFEKMSYDNSEHLKNYLLAYQVTGNDFFRHIAEEIAGFVKNVLSGRERGGFYGSQDADIDIHDDGDYFTWTKEEVKDVLSPEEDRVISLYYNIHSRGEMKHNPAKNVLFVDMEPHEIARRLDIPHEKVKELIKSGRKNLLLARMKRRAPHVDRILYTNWNGMMISAFLLAYKVLGNIETRDLALKTLDFLFTNCLKEGVGFYHTYFDGRSKLTGFLDDQVKMGIACLDAFEVSGNSVYLEKAISLANLIGQKFYDETNGGVFDIEETNDGIVTLKNRFKPIQDDPIPSSNASAALLFDRLYYITDDYRFRGYSEGTLRYFIGIVERFGLYAATYFLALHNHVKHAPQVVIVGEKDDPRVEELQRTAWSIYRPHKITILIDPSNRADANLSQTIREIARMKAPVACVCAGTSCAEPTDDPNLLANTIRTFGIR